MNPFLKLLHNLWACRKILLLTTRTELKKRYAGSVLGLAWVVLYPLLLLGMYMFIYQAVLKVRITGIDSPLEYTFFVLSGIVPYLAFAEVLNAGVLCLSQNRHMISNVIIPMELVPVRLVCVALIPQVAGLLIIMLLMVIFQGKFMASWFLLPITIFFQFLFLSGLAFIFAAVGLVLRDLAQIMAILTLFLMFVSPIGYTVAMVPERFQPLIYLNPVFYLVEVFRQPLINGGPPELTIMLGFGLGSVAIFIIGGYLFKKAMYTLGDFI